MKQPSKKKLRKHFENALTVECLGDGDFYTIDLTKKISYNDFGGMFIKDQLTTHKEPDNVLLWTKEKGYAKILTYKEKTFSITESQIKELKESLSLFGMKERLKEWFPESEAFGSEVKELKIGTWYKHKHEKEFITFVKDDGRRYGIGTNGKWFQDAPEVNDPTAYYEATEQEVFEALKNEAVKRGFKEGVMIKNSYGEELISEETYFDYDYEYDEDGDFLYNGFVLFQNGKWAEIIESITLSEAEQQLGKKIIV